MCLDIDFEKLHQPRRSYSLPLRDSSGRKWDFVIKSWANGTEHRRVYVLEQVSEYIKANRLHEGDVIGICSDECGALSIQVEKHYFLGSFCPALPDALYLHI